MFKRKQKPDADGFYNTTITAVSVSENGMTSIKINGQPLILTKWQDTIYAISAYCPHAAADLNNGEIYKGRVDCPEHGWRFDLKTGRTLFPPDEACRLKRYEVKEEEGILLVKLG